MSRNSSLRRGIIATMPGKWGAATKHIASESASQFHSSISASLRHIICGIGPGLPTQSPVSKRGNQTGRANRKDRYKP